MGARGTAMAAATDMLWGGADTLAVREPVLCPSAKVADGEADSLRSTGPYCADLWLSCKRSRC
jgi:hypothetical protein